MAQRCCCSAAKQLPHHHGRTEPSRWLRGRFAQDMGTNRPYLLGQFHLCLVPAHPCHMGRSQEHASPVAMLAIFHKM